MDLPFHSLCLRLHRRTHTPPSLQAIALVPVPVCMTPPPASSRLRRSPRARPLPPRPPLRGVAMLPPALQQQQPQQPPPPPLALPKSTVVPRPRVHHPRDPRLRARGACVSQRRRPRRHRHTSLIRRRRRRRRSRRSRSRSSRPLTAGNINSRSSNQSRALSITCLYSQRPRGRPLPLLQSLIRPLTGRRRRFSRVRRSLRLVRPRTPLPLLTPRASPLTAAQQLTTRRSRFRSRSRSRLTRLLLQLLPSPPPPPLPVLGRLRAWQHLRPL
jgi:hypothetical protein